MTRHTAQRWLPLIGLLAVALAVYATGLHRQLSFANLQTQRGALQGFMDAHPFAGPLAFMLTYAVATALSLPGAILLTLTAGFLFGTWFGTLLSVVGATTGAVVVFLIARTALGTTLRDRAKPWLQRMEAGFRRDAFAYLLALRLAPLAPFWLVNLVPAVLGVSLGTFVLATGLGIVPGTVVFASVGSGLGSVLDDGEQPNLGLILEPHVLAPLLGLAALALLPVAYRHWRRPSA